MFWVNKITYMNGLKHQKANEIFFIVAAAGKLDFGSRFDSFNY